MNVLELSRIDRAIDIEAPPERVWRALTDSAEIAAWFRVTIEGDVVEGGEIWMTSLSPGHEGQRFQVQIAEMTPMRRVVWRWHPGEIDRTIDYSREPHTTVTFTIEPTGRGTRLAVSETGFDRIDLARRAKVFADNSQGWTEVVVWLQRYAEAQG